MSDGAGLSPVQELADLNWGERQEFLGVPSVDFAKAAVVILPVPYEATASYMPGAGNGPRAIIEASQYLELYDHELDSEPIDIGIHTLAPLILPKDSPELALGELRRVLDTLVEQGKFVLMLGGEHSITAEAVLAHVNRRGDRAMAVLQLDAHADLREEYEGTSLSHACVMHRIHDSVSLVQVGIRSLTKPERELMASRDIRVTFSHEMNKDGWAQRCLDALGEDVYITIDVDFFDPSLVPSTGTPEPDGAVWKPSIDLLGAVFREKRVLGADIVELAPISGLVAPDFLVAKLAYKLVGFVASQSMS